MAVVSTSQKISIMQITHDLNIGGLQRVVVDLACNLNKDRYDVSVCALREGGPYESELLNDGIPIIKLAENTYTVDYLMFWKIYRTMREMRPTIVHPHNTQPFLEGTVAAVLAGVPVVVHTDHGRQFPDKWRYMTAERIVSRFVNQLVAFSEANKSDLVQYEKIPASKIMVVANGINEQKYQFPVDRSWKRKELNIAPDAGPIVGWCGRLSPEKGLDVLIRAVDLLKKDFPGMVFLIAGEGDLDGPLRQEAKERNVERWIRFLGPRSDVHEIMGIIDLFVLPSLREGLPLVLLEAMAASLAIVATNVGGIPGAVVDGVNGLLFKPCHPEEFAAAIKRLLSDEVMREKFAKNSLELFYQRFGLRKMLTGYEEISLGWLTAGPK